MRPPAPAPAAEGAPAAPPPPPEAQRAVPTPFLTKTYQLVDDPSLDDVISWNDGGSAFVVWHPAKFAGEVLPNYFKHNNFSSFVRQLNTYGFRKIASDRWEFAHECFRRGEKRLLCDIHRRKISSAPSSRVGSPSISGDEQIASTNTSPGRAQPAEAPGSGGKASELAEENERLRQENTHLSRELCKMKALCNDIVKLMSKYSPCRRNSGGGEGGPSADEERAEGSSSGREGPRIFGVSIGPKRNRGEDGGTVPCEAGDVGRWPVAGNVTRNGKTLMEKNQDVRHHYF